MNTTSTLRRWRVIALLVTAVAIFVTVLAGITGKASAAVTPLESADTSPAHVRVAYAEPLTRGRVYVDLTDGSAYRFTACRLEDSRNCYWDAAARGNHHGHSFVNLHGTQHRIPARFGGVV